MAPVGMGLLAMTSFEAEKGTRVREVTCIENDSPLFTSSLSDLVL